MSTKPSAINEYMSPIASPLTRSANANSTSSHISRLLELRVGQPVSRCRMAMLARAGSDGGCDETARTQSAGALHLRRHAAADCGLGRSDVVHEHRRSELALAAVLEGNLHDQLCLVGAVIKCANYGGVLLGDEAAPHLAGACDLGVVGVELLVEQHDAADLGHAGQGRIDLLDLLDDRACHLRLARQVHVARVGEAPILGPLADRVHVDGDHGSHEWALVAEGDRLADEGAELELVLDELRGERRAVGELAHVFGTVDDGKMAARVEETGIAGPEPTVLRQRGTRGLLLLVVAQEHAGPLDQHLALLGDAHFGVGYGPPDGVWIGLVIALEGDEAAGFG